MSKCPLCFRTLPPDRLTWMATSGETRLDEIATGYYGPEREGRPMIESRWDRKSNAFIPSREVVSTRLGTPVEEVCSQCHYPIPAGWRDSGTTCIALAGARETGKTVYIAVLVKTLQLFGERMNCVVEPNDRRTADTYREHYEKKLYQERTLLPPTASFETDRVFPRDPLVFRLGHVGGRKQLLVIRDVAGEDLQMKDRTGTAWAEFFGHADGVIHMFDPLKVPSVAHQLRGLIPPQEEHDVTPLEVLQRVLAMIGPRHGPKVAVVLSKFDALHELRKVTGTEWHAIMENPGAGFSRDPGLRPGSYDNDDGELIDAEVRSLLSKCGAKSIVDAVDRPHTGARLPARFFAVSALGALPSGQQVHAAGISPFRCLDPTRWILSGAGIWN
ncbi:TRAFAC clade GTPase domain-containing protein [Nocardia sp. alder85J]|uniref:TRAFAC clade GTPase domain-containing protein n=1 Tax=Nocardia sp. alder85J TaxID=2862949 RepID=UPI001CD355FD|nr:hypothetical protein [Nocardia sp. alder85J]MCX4090918.1 hypothetical protein [Nocardia sp. alder85J]